MIYLDVEDLIRIARRVVGEEVQIRDAGLLGASAFRPQTNFFGYEPYPGLAEKAAALLCSLAQNHALLDGNKRLALAAAWTLCWVNVGRLPEMTNDEAYDLVLGAVRKDLETADVAAALWEAGIPSGMA